MSTTRLKDYVTVREAAIIHDVTRQRMHALIKIYSVNVVAVGKSYLIKRSELRQKIPRKRPVGIHIPNR